MTAKARGGNAPAKKVPNAAPSKGKTVTGKQRKAGGGGKNNKKDECNCKLTKDQKAALRRATPSAGPTNDVNGRARRDAQGRIRCPTCGSCSPPGFKASTGEMYDLLSADHIVSVKQIMSKKGFACLSDANQKEVLNSPTGPGGNFVGLCPPCNTSRKTTPFNQWGGHSTKGMTESGKAFARRTQAKAPALSKSIGARISRMPKERTCNKK